MRAARIRAAAAALLLPAALAACAIPETEEARTARERASRPTIEAQLARLPAEAAGFTRGEARDVEPGNPGWGKLVEYATPDRFAAGQVFLYDLGRPLVSPADLPGEFDRAVREGTALPSQRTAQTLAESERYVLNLPGGDVTCARLDGRFGRERIGRDVCLGIAAGRYLRVQVTMPERARPNVEPRDFVTAVMRAARAG